MELPLDVGREPPTLQEPLGLPSMVLSAFAGIIRYGTDLTRELVEDSCHHTPFHDSTLAHDVLPGISDAPD